MSTYVTATFVWWIGPKKNEANQINAERDLNDRLRKAVGNNHQETSSFIDLEANKDSRTYQPISNLSIFILILSGVLVLFTIIETKYVWDLLTHLNASFKMFSSSDRLLIVLSVGFLGVMQVATFLAIGGLLRIGKDIADNTRATRNYLSHIAQKIE